MTTSRTFLCRQLATITACFMLTACATDNLTRAPQSPSTPWVPAKDFVNQEDKTLQMNGSANNKTINRKSFALPALEGPEPDAPPTPAIDHQHQYTLPELIDMAQRHNPDTRLAWNQARQAALAVGMAESTFLPVLSANVVGGWRKTRTPLPLLPGDPALRTETRGIVPYLALGWLLFDFGGRQAILEGTEHASYAANILFNATHQRIILEVSNAYYNYEAARQRTHIARQTLKNTGTIRKAVQARQAAGLATTVETAQATQQLAQARLRLINAEGTEQAAYQTLTSAIGLDPGQSLAVMPLKDKGLPPSNTPLTEQAIRLALSQRPDVLAAWSASKTSEANIRAAKAQFMPKIYLGAVLAHNHNNFDIAGLPGLNSQTSSSTVLLGISLPLYDAGLRSARLRDAEIEAEKARDIYLKTRHSAAREIILAADALRTALAAYHAATELEAAASTTYNAALDAYRHGLETITVVTVAISGLEDAQQARSDAHALALASAANLAFLMGEMTTSRTSWMPSTTATSSATSTKNLNQNTKNNN